MKTNRETLKASMDRRLSFLDDVPSCRGQLQYRIAQEEKPIMKKKLSFVLLCTVTLILLSAAAVAAGLLLSPRVSASRAADKALESVYGITEEMQTFFGREEEMLPDGTVRVTYTGAGDLSDVLGTYTVLVRNGKAEISWSHDGKDTAGGYDAEVWGIDQLKQMMADSLDAKSKQAFISRAKEIAEKHDSTAADESTDDAIENYGEWREAQKTAALNARILSEEEMIRIGKEYIISSYQLNEEQTERMELYTNSFTDNENSWYEMINEKPCFMVEYLLYGKQTVSMLENGESPERSAKDGYYKVYVNVTDGTIEEYEYNSALAGEG